MKKMHPSRITRTLPRGFTLVELLVVIVIIATLASIAFIAGKRAINSANQATAMSNMKQLSNLVQLFATDHNSILVNVNKTQIDGQTRLWAEHLLVVLSPDLAQDSNYSKSPGDALGLSVGTFSDPKALKQAKGVLADSGHNSWRTFGYNNRIGSYVPETPGLPGFGTGAKTTNQVTTPDKLILFAQAKLVGNAYPFNAQPGDVKNNRIDFTLHDGKSLVGFFDGHVELFGKKNYPSNDGTDPVTGVTYTPAKLNEFWLGNATPYPSP